MRIVTIGSKSFIGSALTKAFVDDGIKALCISRDDIDLESRNSINYLKEVVSDGDIVIAAAAKAPVRDQKELFQNVKIMNNIAEALDNIDLKLFVNVGSDAVYSDSMEPISEISEANPESLHGVMHLLRENVFGTKIRSQKKLFLRFTLVYGKDDPHNGYGPNMFVRNAIAKRPI